MKTIEENECGITGNILKMKDVEEENDITTEKRISGIYKIINKVNEKYYVGSSKNIYNRWREHKQYLIHN